MLTNSWTGLPRKDTVAEIWSSQHACAEKWFDCRREGVDLKEFPALSDGCPPRNDQCQSGRSGADVTPYLRISTDPDLFFTVRRWVDRTPSRQTPYLIWGLRSKHQDQFGGCTAEPQPLREPPEFQRNPGKGYDRRKEMISKTNLWEVFLHPEG